jgi:hypothetical protein
VFQQPLPTKSHNHKIKNHSRAKAKPSERQEHYFIEQRLKRISAASTMEVILRDETSNPPRGEEELYDTKKLGNEYQEDTDDDSSILVRRSGGNCRRMTVVSVICLALVVVAIVLASTISKKNRQTETYGQFSEANGALDIMGSGCSVVQDIKEPKLELYFKVSDPTRLFNAEEITSLEAAIVEGYNSKSLGCDGDEYNRFVYSCSLIHQDSSNYITSSEDFHSVEALFDCKISCDGCTDENAFASEFPSSGRYLSEDLKAAEIMAEISNRMGVSTSFGELIGVTITMSADGIPTDVKRMSSSEWTAAVADGVSKN